MLCNAPRVFCRSDDITLCFSCRWQSLGLHEGLDRRTWPHLAARFAACGGSSLDNHDILYISMISDEEINHKHAHCPTRRGLIMASMYVPEHRTSQGPRHRTAAAIFSDKRHCLSHLALSPFRVRSAGLQAWRSWQRAKGCYSRFMLLSLHWPKAVTIRFCCLFLFLLFSTVPRLFLWPTTTSDQFRTLRPVH